MADGSTVLLGFALDYGHGDVDDLPSIGRAL